MFASVSQSASKGGALAGYETVLGVREGFPLRQEFLKRRGGGGSGEQASRLHLLGVAREAIQTLGYSHRSKVDAVLHWRRMNQAL